MFIIPPTTGGAIGPRTSTVCVGAGALERHLNDAVFLGVAGVIDLELIEDVRIERRTRRLRRREKRPSC